MLTEYNGKYLKQAVKSILPEYFETYLKSYLLKHLDLNEEVLNKFHKDFIFCRDTFCKSLPYTAFLDINLSSGVLFNTIYQPVIEALSNPATLIAEKETESCRIS